MKLIGLTGRCRGLIQSEDHAGRNRCHTRVIRSATGSDHTESRWISKETSGAFAPRVRGNPPVQVVPARDMRLGLGVAGGALRYPSTVAAPALN